MVKNVWQALYDAIAGNSDVNDDGWTDYQMSTESSEEYQARILAKAESDSHLRKRTNNQLNDPDEGLKQANIEQARREGLISKEEYNRELKKLRKDKWNNTGIDDNYVLCEDGIHRKPSEILQQNQEKKEEPKRTRKTMKLIDGYMTEVEEEY